MRYAHLSSVGAAFLALGVLAGCGGGGHGFRVPTDPIVIQGNALPATLSGEQVNYLLPFTGGAGGPYRLELISGALPGGIGTDNATVALVGRPLLDGVFDFTLQLTDTGSTPFTTTTMVYHWVIGKGALVYVTDANLPAWIYNRFDAVLLVLAGGTPPYRCQVVDQPLPAIDEPMPTGVVVPDGSTTVVGAPTGIKTSAPFIYKVSIQAQDHADIPGYPTPDVTTKIFTITVLIPDLVIATTSVRNGVTGLPYADKIDIGGGIPPFLFHLVDALNSPSLLKSEPAHPTDGIAKGTPLGFPADGVAGPYSAKFPEGVYIRETSGDILGVPRRVGAFNNWILYAQSATLPLQPNQNKWKSYSFTMVDGAPPNLALDPSVLQPGNTFSATPPNFLPAMEINIAYNKRFLVTGGVVADGRWDSPHESFTLTGGNTELVGSCSFVSSTFPGLFNPPPGVTWTGATGVLAGTPTGGRGGLRTINVAATDYQLPTPRPAAHTASGICQYNVGPDWVVLTETSASAAPIIPNITMDYNSQTMEIFEASNTFPTVRTLDNTKDLALSHVHPLGGTLNGSLTNIDFLTVSVNPTWWAYDNYNLNAKGARGMQHADPQRVCVEAGYGGDIEMKSFGCGGIYGISYDGFEHPSVPAIELPTIPAAVLAANPALGIYTDGGLLYCYDNSGEFGFVIVRKDSKIQIPVAFNKVASGFQGFGDAWFVASSTRTQMMRMPQICVSPNGRFAAAKLKVSIDNFAETQGTTERLVVFSLAGEKPWAGGTATSAIVDPGGTGTVTNGQYIYADALTMTDKYLYVLKGNNIGGPATSQDQVIYNGHFVFRTDYTASAPATAALLGTPTPNVGGWTNVSGSPVSTTYHRWMTPGTTSIDRYRGGRSNPGTSASFGGTFEASDGTDAAQNSGSVASGVSPDFFAYHFANFFPQSLAPTPFRVSANGQACAIVAGAAQPASGTTFLQYSVYVDYNGTFREAATVKRRFKGPSRVGGLRVGEIYNRIYGAYEGPTSQFEISDNGAKIAAVYNSSASSWSNLMINNTSVGADFREELAVMQGGGASTDPWASGVTNTLVTSGVFTGSLAWKMGCLAFTRDNLAMVFWAGYGLSNPTSYTYINQDVTLQSGSMYAYTFSSLLLEGMLPASAGGHSDITGTSKTYSSSVQNNVVAGNWTGNQGAVGPTGSFYANDGTFFYVESAGALTTSDPTGRRLIGTYVGAATGTVNGRTALRSFAPTFTTYRGFSAIGGYAYYPQLWFHGPMGMAHSRLGTNVSAGATPGTVFFASSYPAYPAGNTYDLATGSFYGGGPANPTSWRDYGDKGGEVFAMRADVGGNPVRLTNLASDTVSRTVNYMQPRADGTQVALQMSTGQSQFSYDHTLNSETIRVVTNIAFTAAGTLSAVPPVVTLEGSVGRASSSMALDSTGTRIYYGFAAGGSNENAMALTEKTLNSLGTAVQSSRTQNGRLTNLSHFEILNAGR